MKTKEVKDFQEIPEEQMKNVSGGEGPRIVDEFACPDGVYDKRKGECVSN